MSLTYDEAFATSREGPAFSNSTMWEGWSPNWCDRCLRDAPFRNGLKGATGCPLILVALSGRIPGEWFIGETADSQDYTCVEFRAQGGGGGGGEPRPRPEPPQDGLFPRPARAVRMLSPTPEDAPGSSPEAVPAAVPAVGCRPAGSHPPVVGAGCGGRRQ
jgi:hypothetical protein